MTFLKTFIIILIMVNSVITWALLKNSSNCDDEVELYMQEQNFQDSN